MLPRALMVGLAVNFIITGLANAQISPGDMNCDGKVDGLDIPLFVECVLNDHCDHCPPDGMVSIPGGVFEMGDAIDGMSESLPVHLVNVDTFFMDAHEVTNQQYADALNWAWTQGGLIEVTTGVVHKAGGQTGYPYCDTTAGPSGSRITWNGNVFGVATGKEDHPMVAVRWYGAVAYCNWRSAMEGMPLCYDLDTWTCDFDVAGFRLPTEAEWEKAAGWDPMEGRHYRFGEHTDGCGPTCLDGRRANYVNSGDPFEGVDPPETTPVGYYDGSNHGGVYQTQDAKSYYGCYDMSGNVWEWCYDRYGSYALCDPSPCDNPHGPTIGLNRILRGGGWYNVPTAGRSAFRYEQTPDMGSSTFGFRCALMEP